ncbi:conjugative transposon protein TraM [Flavobacterium sp. YJ01]|mgnify:CR=1 FL=1|uniref:conjugative transposon protein TraM n=1 Tax=Flavobacterium sp. YJ01 TaxID=3031997 RepID=UPI0023E3EC5B|nr:conjugative transposon protein TraM [Flavobacterium sp. YJ01]WET03939.1 conjugative transposon protein TraM [Flavobacterium sp. YJ01]
MENKKLSVKERKNRKMMLVLPLIILPFVTMLFWVLGGGKGKETAFSGGKKQGFNMLLPNPKLKEDSSLDKMSYYDQASVDSIKLEEQKKKDPNYSITKTVESNLEFDGSFDLDAASIRNQKGGLNTGFLKPENEKMMYQKLEALQKAIAEPPKVNGYDQDMREFQYQKPPYGESVEMKNLEQLMAAMSAPSEPDPELAQLGGMLENILDIQHPERVQEKLRENSKFQKGKVFSVSRKSEEQTSSYLQNTPQSALRPDNNSFYSLEDETISDEIQNAVEAAVHETQTIVNGSIVKIRLVQDVFINGVLIPRNSFVFGTASLKGERLEIKVSTIKYQNSIFPVELSVFDIDGIKGIYIPGTINRDVAKASADRSMQSIGLAGVSDSWGAQAAGMGVEAAKTLLSKKVKLIKVVVKAGYKVLLYDEKEKNEK